MDYLDEFVEFPDEIDCPHDRRLIFQIANTIVYECPACGDVIREGKRVE